MSQPNNTPKPKRKYTKKAKLPPVIEDAPIKLSLFEKFINWLLKD